MGFDPAPGTIACWDNGECMPRFGNEEWCYNAAEWKQCVTKDWMWCRCKGEQCALDKVDPQHESCEAYCKAKGVREENIYLWLDFSSIDQDDEDGLVRGVNSLALYVCSSDAFVSIDHADYFDRGWCLMECMFADCSKVPRFKFTTRRHLTEARNELLQLRPVQPARPLALAARRRVGLREQLREVGRAELVDVVGLRAEHLARERLQDRRKVLWHRELLAVLGRHAAQRRAATGCAAGAALLLCLAATEQLRFRGSGCRRQESAWCGQAAQIF